MLCSGKLTKLIVATKTCYIPNIKTLGLPVSEKKNFKVSFLVPISELVSPPGQVKFLPQGHQINKHGKGPLGDDTYQISNFYAFHFQRRILKFSFFVPMFKFVHPHSGASFDPMGNHITNLVEVHYDILHTKNQNSKSSIFRAEF